jgi:hypothetical protein
MWHQYKVPCSARSPAQLTKPNARSATVPVDELALADLKVSLSAASFATERIGFVSQKNGTSRSYRFCFGALRRRTPGPPPFSSMNSTLANISCGFGAQRLVSGFFFSLVASSTILLIASAREGTSV